MAKWANDSVMDAALAHVATCTMLRVCSSQPADRTAAIAATLAAVAMTAGAGNGDYALADGDASGRKLTVLQQSAIGITASGTATHVTLDDGATLRYVTTCTSQALTSGGTVTVPAWDIEIADPS
jgi:hypothetical protein